MQEFDNNKVPVKKLWQVIVASSVGTVIEWYDFYIFGSLSAIISLSFFPKEDPTAAFISTLAAFGAGFVARPFGGVLFGRLGDLIGRKYTFLLTLLLMGGLGANRAQANTIKVQRAVTHHSALPINRNGGLRGARNAWCPAITSPSAANPPFYE